MDAVSVSLSLLNLIPHFAYQLVTAKVIIPGLCSLLVDLDDVQCAKEVIKLLCKISETQADAVLNVKPFAAVAIPRFFDFFFDDVDFEISRKFSLPC